jgi:hypothetical protein
MVEQPHEIDEKANDFLMRTCTDNAHYFCVLRQNYCLVVALAAPLLACTRRVSITTEVPPDYGGEGPIDARVSGTPSVAHVGRRGKGQTSTCLGKNDRLSVFCIQGDTRTESAQQRVRVETTGDALYSCRIAGV